MRRIRYRDPASGKTLVFLTNRTDLEALTICDLYKSRWQVELFFKIKQHLRIKRFFGTSENAVKSSGGRLGLRAGRRFANNSESRPQRDTPDPSVLPFASPAL